MRNASLQHDRVRQFGGEYLDADGKKMFDMHTDPKGGTIRGLIGPGGIGLNSPKLAALTRPVTEGVSPSRWIY